MTKHWKVRSKKVDEKKMKGLISSGYSSPSVDNKDEMLAILIETQCHIARQLTEQNKHLKSIAGTLADNIEKGNKSQHFYSGNF